MTVSKMAAARRADPQPAVEWPARAVVIDETLPPAAGLDFRRVPTFLFVGGTTAVVDIGTMRTLFEFGAELTLATTIGFALGVCVHFALSRRLTFRAHRQSAVPQFRRYMIGTAISYSLAVSITRFGYQWMGVDPAFWRAVAVGVSMVFTFCWLSLVVFRGAKRAGH